MIEFAQGRVPKENLARFATSCCYQFDNLKRLVAHVYANAEPRDVRELMLENLWEEHGEGDDSRDHTALVGKFAQAFGATVEDIYDVEPIPESREWIDRMPRVCREEPFVVGLAAISFGIEFRTQTMAAQRDYGVVLTGELEDYSLEVDQEATRRRREELRSERERASGNGEGE